MPREAGVVGRGVGGGVGGGGISRKVASGARGASRRLSTLYQNLWDLQARLASALVRAAANPGDNYTQGHIDTLRQQIQFTEEAIERAEEMAREATEKQGMGTTTVAGPKYTGTPRMIAGPRHPGHTYPFPRP